MKKAQAIGITKRQMRKKPDPFLVAQQILDEQMQYMDNPFLMPGMGPMMGGC
jgi:hypothetical protein